MVHKTHRHGRYLFGDRVSTFNSINVISTRLSCVYLLEIQRQMKLKLRFILIFTYELFIGAQCDNFLCLFFIFLFLLYHIIIPQSVVLMKLLVACLCAFYVAKIYCTHNNSANCFVKSTCSIDNSLTTGNCISRSSGCCLGNFSDSYCPGSGDMGCCVDGVKELAVGISEWISRADVKTRAQDWVNRQIPYSQIDLTG